MAHGHSGFKLITNKLHGMFDKLLPIDLYRVPQGKEEGHDDKQSG